MLLATSTDPINTAAWYYVELKVVCDATSAGSVELHLNGTEAFPAYTGVTKTDQQSDDYNTTFRLQNGVSQQSLFDDLYCLDSYDLNSDGSNTAFLGPRCVYTILPAADVEGEQWLCSFGFDHYAMVRDEWGTDDDATYVWTNEDWVSDFYTCDTLPEGVTGINGIMLVADVRKTESGAGTRNFTLLVYSESGEGGEMWNGNTVTLDNTLWKSYWGICEYDPGTWAAWESGNLAAAQIGFSS